MPSFVHRMRVRYHECDAQGVVFNANYVAYFDVAMTELWRTAFGSYAAMVESGADMVVREVTVTYHAPARFDDLIDLHASVVHLGRTSMVSELAVRRDGELLVDGRLVHVFVVPGTAATLEIPVGVRTALRPWTAVPTEAAHGVASGG